MITPKLEELILKGRAFFKTFVAGGGQKNTLNIQEDRFIIITDLTYFPMYVESGNPGNKTTNENTQVSIYGDRGFNHYVFRNFVSPQADQLYTPGVICINTYLMHTEAVGFSFSNAKDLTGTFSGIAPEFNPGYAPPLEYGKAGLPGALNVVQTSDTAPGLAVYNNNYVTRPAGGSVESQQLQFPVNTDTAFTGIELLGNKSYPLMLVNYVEILGLPNNLGI